jgi:CRISPR/Cas system-associated exonuclease Cas4 (RecB family)
MSIYLSATAIKDFIACPKRIFYRTNFPELAEATPDMQAGNVVHETLEKYWSNKESAISFCREEIQKLALSGEMSSKILLAVNNFFINPVKDLLKNGDLIEHKFKIPLDDNSFMVGKIDRITSNGTVIDWKTSTKTPRSIDKDPQFLTYFWAYKNLFKRNQNAILYVSLIENKIVRLTPNVDIYYQLFHNVIPSILIKIRKNDLPPIGLFNGSCYGCNFKKICATDMQNELGK